MKKGISLIVLIITIIVVIILAGAVILNLSDTDIIENANEAVIKSNIDAYQSEFSLWASGQYLSTDGSFILADLNADETTGSYQIEGVDQTISDIIPNMSVEDQAVYEISNGQLVVKSSVTNQVVIDAASEVGVAQAAEEFAVIVGNPAEWTFDTGTQTLTAYLGSDTEIEIPSSLDGVDVLVIGNSLFQSNTNITSVIIGNGIITIGNQAFLDCVAITSITMPDSVINIGDNVFSGCFDLENITISSNVTSIGSGVFKYCQKITSITIPDGVTIIEDLIFSCCYSLSNVTIGSGVVFIDSNAFDRCINLTSITIPSNVNDISVDAFYLCDNLTDITINKVSGSISNSPWGATNAIVTWNG